MGIPILIQGKCSGIDCFFWRVNETLFGFVWAILTTFSLIRGNEFEGK